MSNELAIAAVTTTLRNLISQGVGEALGSGIVTTRPPDKARETGDGSNQINLFLYQTQINEHWRNRDMPLQGRSGETGRSPLPLNLYYLITAYGQDNDDVSGHRLLGSAMRTLYDNAVLSPRSISVALAESDLQNQVERIRITPVTLSLDELSKLWTTFQTQYRISMAYEVSVVLIESTRPGRAPLPVLVRGTDDQGLRVQANLLPPYPLLERIEFPRQQPAAQMGDRLLLKGNNLMSDSGSVQVLFKHTRLDDTLVVSGESQNSETIVVTLPAASPPWLAGFYTMTVQLQRETRDETSNAISMAIAPRIESFQRELSDEGEPILRLTCQPPVQASQRVTLLLGSRSIPLLRPDDMPNAISSLTFSLRDIPAGNYWIRLRVDGVDSLLVDRSVAPPQFDERWRVSLP